MAEDRFNHSDEYFISGFFISNTPVKQFHALGAHHSPSVLFCSPFKNLQCVSLLSHTVLLI